MIPLYFVFRPTSTGYRPDHTDPDGVPLGEYTEEAAVARIESLKASYRKRMGKEMDPPPVVTLGAVPKMKPRKREKKHRYEPHELNGHSHSRQPVLEQEARR